MKKLLLVVFCLSILICRPVIVLNFPANYMVVQKEMLQDLMDESLLRKLELDKFLKEE